MTKMSETTVCAAGTNFGMTLDEMRHIIVNVESQLDIDRFYAEVTEAPEDWAKVNMLKEQLNEMYSEYDEAKRLLAG